MFGLFFFLFENSYSVDFRSSAKRACVLAFSFLLLNASLVCFSAFSHPRYIYNIDIIDIIYICIHCIRPNMLRLSLRSKEVISKRKSHYRVRSPRYTYINIDLLIVP